MLVLEAITERPPWGDANDLAVIRKVSSSETPDVPESLLSPGWRHICFRCWEFCPPFRPTMAIVMDRLSLHDHEPDMKAENMPPPGQLLSLPPPMDVSPSGGVLRRQSAPKERRGDRYQPLRLLPYAPAPAPAVARSGGRYIRDLCGPQSHLK